MDGQIFTLGLATPQKHAHQADPGKDKKKTRRAEAAGLRAVAAVCEQTVGSRNPSAPPRSTNPDKQLLPEAPVGHRQPRADQVPSEKNLMGDPNDPINRENAALDRMVKGFCRGC